MFKENKQNNLCNCRQANLTLIQNKNQSNFLGYTIS